MASVLTLGFFMPAAEETNELLDLKARAGVQTS
jgi:hypothetical protein